MTCENNMMASKKKLTRGMLLSVCVCMMLSHDMMAMKKPMRQNKKIVSKKSVNNIHTVSCDSLDNSFSSDNTVTENFIPATMLPDSKIKATFGGEGFKRMIEALKKTGNYDIVDKSSRFCGCCVRDYMAVHIKSKKKASENFTDFYTLVRNAYTYNYEVNSVMNSRRDTHSVYKDKIFSDFVFGKERYLYAN